MTMNCVIYQIVCKDVNITDSYIGSTTDVKQRMRAHKSRCNNPNCKGCTCKLYQFIREHGGWNNWEMTIQEEFTCNNKFEKLQKERYWIKYINPSLNTYTPANVQMEGIYTKSEWDNEYYKHNMEDIKEYKKDWYTNNRNKVLERMNTKYNCGCGGKYTHGDRRKHNRTKNHQQYLLRESIKQIQEMKQTMNEMMNRMDEQQKIINSLALYIDE